MKRMIFGLALLLGGAAAAQSPPLIANAIAAGQVGERYDGYMGFVTAPSLPLKRQVDAVNLRRRNLYIQLAQRRNVTAEVVGLATACQLFAQLPVGEPYFLNDQVWRRRGGGAAAPVPTYCR